MTYDSPVAVKLAEDNGLIDKLELETAIPSGDRALLARWQAKIAANKSTRIDEDLAVINILLRWAKHIHKLTK